MWLVRGVCLCVCGKRIFVLWVFGPEPDFVLWVFGPEPATGQRGATRLLLDTGARAEVGIGTVIRGISIGDDPKLVSGKANGGQSMYVIAEYCRKK